MLKNQFPAFFVGHWPSKPVVHVPKKLMVMNSFFSTESRLGVCMMVSMSECSSEYFWGEIVQTQGHIQLRMYLDEHVCDDDVV